MPCNSLAAVDNSLVSRRAMVQEGWSGIDAQLKRRADLIPNLVETVKGFAKHEEDAINSVTAARAAMVGAPRAPLTARPSAPPR